MIRRSPRPDSNFYVLDKAISEDTRLSWAARGVLIFLLGKPDNWEVSPAALVNATQGALRPTGRDGIYAIIKELVAIGYMQVDVTRKDGRFQGTAYTVSEVAAPCADNPDTAPRRDIPDTANPDRANPTQTRTDSKQELKGNKEAAAPRTTLDSLPDDDGWDPSPLPPEPIAPVHVVRSKSAAEPMPEIPDWMPAEPWNDWVKHRQAIKFPLTALAAKACIRELTKFREDGHDPADVIMRSIASGYRGLFADKAQGGGGGGGARRNNGGAVAEVARMMKRDGRL